MARRTSSGRPSYFRFAIQSLEPRLPLHGAAAVGTAVDGTGIDRDRPAIVSMVDAFEAEDGDVSSMLANQRLADAVAGRSIASTTSPPSLLRASVKPDTEALRTKIEPRARMQGMASTGPAVLRFGDPVVSANKKLVTLRVTFDSAVKVRGNPFIAFTLNGEARRLLYSGRGGGTVLTFTYKAGRREKPTSSNVSVASPTITLPPRALIADRAGNAAASLTAPTDVSLSNAIIPENNAVGTVIATLATSDVDAGRDTFTYALVAGDGSADNAAFTVLGDSLCASASFDFESKSSYAVRVRSTDRGGLFTERAFTIYVTNVNDTPTQVAISNTTIADNVLQGAAGGAARTVGTLTASDPDANSLHTYLLVDGDGAADNGSFTIDGNQLKSAAIFNADVKSTYSIRVRATDSGGLSIEKQITITVTKSTQMPSRGRPAEALNITGAFDPSRNYDVVMRTADGREIVVTPQAVTSTAITFATPLMFDPNTWAVGPATVSVVVRMSPATATRAMASAAVETVRIRDAFLVDDLPSTDAPLGSLAAVTLEDWMSSVDRTIELTRLIATLTNGTIDVTEPLTFLEQYRILLGTMYAAGEALVDGVVDKVVVGRVGDLDLVLTRDSIAVIERIIASQLLPPSDVISTAQLNDAALTRAGARGVVETAQAKQESLASTQGSVVTGPTRDRLVAMYAKDRMHATETIKKWQDYASMAGTALTAGLGVFALATTGGVGLPAALEAGSAVGTFLYVLVGIGGSLWVGHIEKLERQVLGMDPSEEGFACSTQALLDTSRNVAVDKLVDAVKIYKLFPVAIDKVPLPGEWKYMALDELFAFLATKQLNEMFDEAATCKHDDNQPTNNQPTFGSTITAPGAVVLPGGRIGHPD